MAVTNLSQLGSGLPFCFHVYVLDPAAVTVNVTLVPGTILRLSWGCMLIVGGSTEVGEEKSGVGKEGSSWTNPFAVSNT